MPRHSRSCIQLTFAKFHPKPQRTKTSELFSMMARKGGISSAVLKGTPDFHFGDANPFIETD